MPKSEHQLEYNKQYYETNKDTINAARNIKIECGCGATYTKRHQSTHVDTIRHKQWMETSGNTIIKKTPEEVIEDTKQKKKEQAKKWRDKNRDQLREYAKLYSQEYRKTHSESIEAYQTEWLAKNYDKYKEDIENIKKLHFEGDDDKIDESTLIHILIQKLKKSIN